MRNEVDDGQPIPFLKTNKNVRHETVMSHLIPQAKHPLYS